MKLFKNKNNILMLIILSFLYISLDTASAAKLKEPILVVDKCPEFCPKPTTPIKTPKPIKLPKPTKPSIEMCTQALIPVPGRPGYWYTDGCKKTIISEPKIKNTRK